MSTKSTIITRAQGNMQSQFTDTALVFVGWPDPEPQEFPWCAISADAARYESMSFGGVDPFAFTRTGTIMEEYIVNIIVRLGPRDMLRTLAHSASEDWDDGLRTAFAGDPTMGGLCFNCDLLDGESNIATYRETGDYPQIAYRLQVQELKTYGAERS